LANISQSKSIDGLLSVQSCWLCEADVFCLDKAGPEVRGNTPIHYWHKDLISVACGHPSATSGIFHLSAMVLRLNCGENVLPTAAFVSAPVIRRPVRKRTQSKKTRSRQRHTAKEKRLKSPAQTILIVDDDESALRAIARLIRSAGFKVRAFSHPKALLNEPLPTQNACLIADIYLPEMTGDELCHTLAAAGHALPTILITGRNDEAARRLVEKSEAIAVLFKPIDEVPLLKAISRCLNTAAGEC
jgi:CheY-like chemotaxis protein